MFQGLIGGLLYLALRPWLDPLGRGRGLTFGLVILALMGHAVLEPGNGDFRRFGVTGLNVALFAALFVVYGIVIEPLFSAIAGGAERSRVVAAIAWLGVLPGLLFSAMDVGATVARLLGQNTAFRPAFGLLVVGTLLAGIIGRRIGPPHAAARAIVFAVVIAGALVTATDVARIFLDRPILPG